MRIRVEDMTFSNMRAVSGFRHFWIPVSIVSAIQSCHVRRQRWRRGFMHTLLLSDLFCACMLATSLAYLLAVSVIVMGCTTIYRMLGVIDEILHSSK